MRFEYDIAVVAESEDMLALLNARGGLGWLLCAVTELRGLTMCYFVRDKEER